MKRKGEQFELLLEDIASLRAEMIALRAAHKAERADLAQQIAQLMTDAANAVPVKPYGVARMPGNNLCS